MNLIPGNAQHIGARRQQQDSFGFSDPADANFRQHGGLLAVVADGMGGMAHGDAAARIAVKVFLESYAAKTEAESIPDALSRCLQSANQAVFQLASERGSAGETGTTLIAAVVAERKMHWISAGDSGIFLWRDGEFTLINEAHIYAHELDARAARNLIPRQAALDHPEREALTSFLGLERIPLADRSLRPFHLRDHDILLLATDGLFKTLTFSDMGECLTEGDSQEIAEALVARTIAAEFEFQDNVTAVVIVAKPERPVPAAAPPSKKAKTRRPATEAKADAVSSPPPPPRIVAQWEKELKPPPPPKPSRTARALILLGLAVAAAYAYYLFTYSTASIAPRNPEAAAPPRAGGEAFEPASLPAVDRLPNQTPPPPAEPAGSAEGQDR
jgi:protein phosphatase